MIFHQQTNIAAFAGNLRPIWILQPIPRQLISVTSAVAAANRLLLLNPPGLHGGFDSGPSL